MSRIKQTHIKNQNSNDKVENDKKKENAVVLSLLSTNNEFGAALIIDKLFAEQLDVVTIVDNLRSRIDKIVDGDLRSIESALVTETQILDALFKSMLIRASSATLINQLQVYTELALKAQSQVRQTLALLAEIKNPKRSTFIKQQNNAINQQINHANESNDLEKTENKSITANELLIEADKHEALELRKSQKTSGINSTMEAMATIDRS